MVSASERGVRRGGVTSIPVIFIFFLLSFWMGAAAGVGSGRGARRFFLQFLPGFAIIESAKYFASLI